MGDEAGVASVTKSCICKCEGHIVAVVNNNNKTQTNKQMERSVYLSVQTKLIKLVNCL